MKNWKTTIFGMLQILSVVFNVIVSGHSVGAIELGQVATGVGLIVAKDAKKEADHE